MNCTFQIHLKLLSPDLDQHNTVQVSVGGLIMLHNPVLDEYVRTFVACKEEKYEYQVDPDWWHAYQTDPQPLGRLRIRFKGEGRMETVNTFGITGFSLFWEFEEGEVAL